MGKWWMLVRERFSPAAYIPMIFLFTMANGLFLTIVTGTAWSWPRFVAAFILMLSFFFRMRLFDEIKDYEVDLRVNPTRPLARGILKVSEVKIALIVLIIFELFLASTLGVNSFIVHAMAIGYSLLMYEEFFIGDALRPHLTTYAVTHTFVSTLLGLSSGVAMTGVDLSQLPVLAYIFFSMNWAFFNLFEFARKTFAPSEERDHVPSYSKIFGPWGAWGLSVSQAILGVAVVVYYRPHPWLFISLTLYILLSLLYVLKPSVQSTKIFRSASAAYLLVHYAILIYVLGV